MPSARLATAIGALALTGALVVVPVAGAKGKARVVPGGGVVRLGAVRCAGGEACLVKATPKRIAAKVAGRKVKARVLAPPLLGPGARAAVKLRFGRGARERLAGHAATFRARVVVRGSGKRIVRRFKVRLRGPATRSVAPGGTGVGGSGGSSGGPPHSEPVSGEPPPLARPLTAVGVEGVSLEWFPRASWIAYVASGEGTSAGDGATGVVSASPPCPARAGSGEGSLVPSASLPYEIDFSGAASWYDPASGMAAVEGTGSVSFRFRAHTINLTLSEPEIQINGASSSAVFRVSGSDGTPYPNQRVALLGLNTTGQPITSTAAGKTTYSYDLMRARLTPDGEKVFAGFYAAPGNNGFGCVSVSFTGPARDPARSGGRYR